MRMSVGRRYGDPARRWPDVPARQTALRRGFKSADEEKSRLEQRARDAQQDEADDPGARRFNVSHPCNLHYC